MDVNDPQDLLAAWALDAVDDNDVALVEERIARDPDFAVAAVELQQVAALLGSLPDPVVPESDLRTRVLGAAVDVRRVGEGPDHPADPIDAYLDQVAELAAALELVPVDAWNQLTAAGFSVHGLVAHLVAVERYLGSFLGGAPFDAPEGTETDHVEMTLATVAARSGQAPEVTVADWRAAVTDNEALLRALPPDALDRRVNFHQLSLRIRSVLATRVFELWTHTDDVRRALGRPLGAPGPDRLRLMSDVAVGGLPLGFAVAGFEGAGKTAKIVLTGRGGGTWTQALGLGERPGAPDVVVVADVVAFCRVAAQRLAAVDVEVDVEGDEVLARQILVGIAMFAA